MKTLFNTSLVLLTCLIVVSCSSESLPTSREVIDLNDNWQFILSDNTADFSSLSVDTETWRTLDLPHDWSIESDFSSNNPATPGGGALPGGTGWYRKNFHVDKSLNGKQIFIDFDGIYRCSSVWINGRFLGFRPNGYISFQYNLTPYIEFGGNNVIAVKVDNSEQPNSRWYSGSGIYRNVRLQITNPVHIEQWGIFVKTPQVSKFEALLEIDLKIQRCELFDREGDEGVQKCIVDVSHVLYDREGKKVSEYEYTPDVEDILTCEMRVQKPHLWSPDDPYLYTLVSQLIKEGDIIDEQRTAVGFRYFEFDPDKGFILNGKHVKINGVCNHHDLGCLGAAINYRALERQLEILKDMGCNGIRCAHNPPAPELLDLCDKMGFIVMNEAFDMWMRRKSTYDYARYFQEWHEQDLTDLILRDRNHPSVFMWSIGNEVLEQWSDAKTDALSLQKANVLLNQKKEIDPQEFKSGAVHFNQLLTQRLAEIVKSLDTTRPITAGCNETGSYNHLFRSGAIDIIGYNYHLGDYAGVKEQYPGKPFIGAETVSGLMSRGFYMMPSDTMYIWPERWDKAFSRDINHCSSYDNCHVPWGNSHEESWKYIKKADFVSGQYIWTGFDYLGEPTPFWWPSRSSYFGIIDLAGFPKDIYYMYQSEWTNKDVLHVFPHWNWNSGDLTDIWAYFNNADEVELFLNNRSLGIKKKEGDDLHVSWRVPFEAGSLKAVSRKNGKEVLVKEIKTAGSPASLRLTADRNTIKSGTKDLSYVTVEMLDDTGYPIPVADQLVRFSVKGSGTIVGTDNGDPTDPNSLKKPERKLFNGKCLVVLQSGKEKGEIKLIAETEGFPKTEIKIRVN